MAGLVRADLTDVRVDPKWGRRADSPELPLKDIKGTKRPSAGVGRFHRNNPKSIGLVSNPAAPSSAAFFFVASIEIAPATVAVMFISNVSRSLICALMRIRGVGGDESGKLSEWRRDGRDAWYAGEPK
jgi:hypothetical protein